MGLGPAKLSFTVLKAQDVPESTFPRLAVLGRSNVGKSSFLNSLLHPHKLFRTSSQAGKTVGLVAAHLRLGKSEASTLEIVDVPGFGFAPAKAQILDSWGDLLEALRNRSRSSDLLWVWLVDPLRKPEALEYELLQWLGPEPFLFVFTKEDKIKPKDKAEVEELWREIIERSSEKAYWLSSMKGTGMKEVQNSLKSFMRSRM